MPRKVSKPAARPRKTTTPSTVEVFPEKGADGDPTGQYLYRQRSASGRTSNVSEAYDSKSNAMRAISENDALKDLSIDILDPDGQVVQHFPGPSEQRDAADGE